MYEIVQTILKFITFRFDLLSCFFDDIRNVLYNTLKCEASTSYLGVSIPRGLILTKWHELIVLPAKAIQSCAVKFVGVVRTAILHFK